jgi:3',5'-cyclic AMP phosphodiesterase CpdA
MAYSQEMEIPRFLRSCGLAAVLAAVVLPARAQEISIRLTAIPSAPIARAWTGSPAALSAPALAPALAAPLAPATLSAAVAPAGPVLAPLAVMAAFPAASAANDGKPAAPPAAASPASAPDQISGEAARAGAERMWDGGQPERGGSSFVEDYRYVKRLAEPYRTTTQLAKLAKAPRADGERYRFAVIGDAEPGRFWVWRALFNRDRSAFWSKLLPRADRSGADFIMQLGDMVSRGIVANFKAFFERLRSAAPRTPYLTVIGNHDRHSPHGVSNSGLYRSLFGRTNYAFDRGGRRFVVVDNSAGRITAAQLDWLRGVLSADKPAIVFTHMPPAPLGEWTDFGKKGAGGFRTGAEAFMELMSERRVARVYMGHVHGSGVLVRGGVTYVLTGGGGSPLFPSAVKDRFHHYLTVDDGPDGLVETVHRSDGTSFRLPL